MKFNSIYWNNNVVKLMLILLYMNIIVLKVKIKRDVFKFISMI